MIPRLVPRLGGYVSRHGHAFIDRALYLPKGWTDDLPDLIENRGDRVGAQRLGVARKLLLPETQRFGIAHAADDMLAEVIVGIKASEIDEGQRLAHRLAVARMDEGLPD